MIHNPTEFSDGVLSRDERASLRRAVRSACDWETRAVRHIRAEVEAARASKESPLLAVREAGGKRYWAAKRVARRLNLNVPTI